MLGYQMGWLTLPLALFAATFVQSQFLFHGTSVIIYPNGSSPWPHDSEFLASNFYCYFNLSGYLSFGWWLPVMPNTNTSHCNPRPETYDWYEYTTSWKCSETQCRAHTINWSTTNETQPYFEDEYVLSSIDIGNGKLGQFGVSYFDSKGGGYAIGTKRILSDETGDPEVVMDCKDAFRTLLEIQKDKNIDLPFDMVDICPFQKGGQAQKVLGGDLK